MILLILPLLPELSMSQCCLGEIPSQLAAFPVSITLAMPFSTDKKLLCDKNKFFGSEHSSKSTIPLISMLN